MGDNNRGGVVVQSIAKACMILRCFESKTEMGISEIAHDMDMSKSTVYGLVNTLTIYGFLDQVDQSNKYRLGLKLFELGNLVQQRLDVRQEARPWCQLLAEKYRTTVHLATHSDGEIIYIDKVSSSDSSIVIYSQVGKRAPMHCTGLGKTLLAYMPDDYLEQFIFSRPLEKFTKNTITSKDKLLEELKKVEKQAYAIDNEEIELGLICVSVPIFDSMPVPSIALSVSFHYGRFWEMDIEEVARDVQYYGRQISEHMGYVKG